MSRLTLLLLLALGLACMGGDKASVTDPPEDDSTPSTGEFEGDAAGECEDGADNDRDGAFDCDDADCDGAPACDTSGDGGGDSRSDSLLNTPDALPEEEGAARGAGAR